MKKLLLSLTALAVAGGAMADNFILGDKITASDLASMQGEHQVIIKAYTKQLPGFIHSMVQPNSEEIYFATKNNNMTEQSLFSDDYVYTINVTVDENNVAHFTLKNSVGGYLPIPSSVPEQRIFSTTTEADATTLHARTGISESAILADYFMLESDNNGGLSKLAQIHFNDPNNSCYFLGTGPDGLADAGGLDNRGGSGNTRTAAACIMYHAESANFPVAGKWYRMRSCNTASPRDNTYMGYYPTTPWYVFNKDDGTKTAKVTNNYIAAGNLAKYATLANDDEISGQLWQFIEGEGENKGKYCMVNMAHPDGAISNVIAPKPGQTTATDDNNSRWIYVENRSANPSEVCWFDLSKRKTFNDQESVNLKYKESGNCYMGFAVGGNNFQLMRNNNAEGNDNYWTPELYFEEQLDEVFDEATSQLKNVATGFASMKAAINNENLPDYSDVTITKENFIEKITEANEAYQAYINKFNNKLVTIYNNRRAGSNYNSPWLTVYMRNDVASINTKAEANDDSKWTIRLDNNKVRFYNLTTGLTLHNSLLEPQAVNGGTRFHINGSSDYLHLSTNGGNIMDWWDANDSGSVWTIALASYTFAEPEISTAEAPKYYRILSDRMMVKEINDRYDIAKTPMFAVMGENRTTSGPNEQVAFQKLGQTGIYWRIENGSTEGSVKIFNLIDEYAMSAQANKRLTTNEAANGVEFFIHRLNDAYVNGNNGAKFSIANTFALSNSSTEFNNYHSLNLNGSNEPYVAAWSPAGDNRDCLTIDGNGGNGALFYFIPATDEEVQAATTAYINAVKARISNYFDDTENLTKLAGEAAVADYVNAITATDGMEMTTIAGVNAAHRTGKEARVAAAISTILDEYVAGQQQHIQLSTTKEASNWATRFLKGNGNALSGVTDEKDIATVWTIEKSGDNYKIHHSASERALGPIDTNNKLVEAANAQAYNLTYNTTLGRFAITKAGLDLGNTSGSIHMSSNDGAITNWSAAGIENSHWYISALEEPVIGVSASDYKCTIKLNGEFTEKATDEKVLVTITRIEDANPEGAQMSRAANDNGTSFTVADAKANNMTLTTRLDAGNYTIEIPGLMLTTQDGKHTRAINRVFTVDEVGTDIKEISGTAEATGIAYDLQGRRVANPRKGIFIIDGRKVRL